MAHHGGRRGIGHVHDSESGCLLRQALEVAGRHVQEASCLGEVVGIAAVEVGARNGVDEGGLVGICGVVDEESGVATHHIDEGASLAIRQHGEGLVGPPILPEKSELEAIGRVFTIGVRRTTSARRDSEEDGKEQELRSSHDIFPAGEGRYAEKDSNSGVEQIVATEAPERASPGRVADDPLTT